MPGDETVDVVVIGSGIGGLSCAGWLAKYGLKVRRRKGADSVASTWVACRNWSWVCPCADWFEFQLSARAHI